MKLKSSICTASLLLFGLQGNAVSQDAQSSHVREPSQDSPRACSRLGCNRARPVTDTNPFGIDFGWGGAVSYSGVPTRALAMAKAQTQFAGERCPDTSMLKRMTFATAYLGIFGPAVKPDYLRPFWTAVDSFKATYDDAWKTLDDDQRKSFCEKYYADISFKTKNFKVPPSEFYLLYLAPLSEEGHEERERKMKRAEKMKWLAVFAQVLSLTAQVSAAHDSIQTGRSALHEGRQGNIGGMNSQMSQSRALASQSAAFANTGRYFAAFSTAEANPANGAVVGPEITLDCNALIHFSKWDAPPHAETWKSYQSLSNDCATLDLLRK